MQKETQSSPPGPRSRCAAVVFIGRPDLTPLTLDSGVNDYQSRVRQITPRGMWCRCLIFYLRTYYYYAKIETLAVELRRQKMRWCIMKKKRVLDLWYILGNSPLAIDPPWCVVTSKGASAPASAAEEDPQEEEDRRKVLGRQPKGAEFRFARKTPSTDTF